MGIVRASDDSCNNAVQRSYDVKDRNRALALERAEPDEQHEAEQKRISWLERELDHIAKAIREVREYIERAMERARELAQARSRAGVDRDDGRSL